MLQCYHALVRTFLSYGITIWEATYPIYVFKIVKSLQNRAIRTVARCHYRDQENPYHINLKILQIDDLLSKITKFVHCCITNVLIGNYFCKIVKHSVPRHLDATNLTWDNSLREYWLQKLLTFALRLFFHGTLFFKTINFRLLNFAYLNPAT